MASEEEKPPGRFFAIGGENGFTKEGQRIEAEHGVISVSDDGKEWRTVFRGGMVKENFSHGNNNMIRGITFGNGRYVAVGNPGIGIMASEDGENWRHVTQYGDKLTGFNVAYGNDIFVIARAGDLLRSEDGLKWSANPTPIEGLTTFGEGGLGHMRQVVYGNGVFVCLGDNRIATTRDGRIYDHVEFHADDGFRGRQTLQFGNGRFLWLRTGGHLSSVDGVTWEDVVIDPDANEKARMRHAIGTLYDGEQFLAGDRNAYHQSPRGLKWQRREAKGYVRMLSAGNGVVLGNGKVEFGEGGPQWRPMNPKIPRRVVVFLPTSS